MFRLARRLLWELYELETRFSEYLTDLAEHSMKE
jgi:hypothetical protein